MSKSDITKGIMAMLIMFGIIALTILFIKYDGSDKKKDVDLSLELDSDIVSTDPKVSASNFIKSAGTMGDYDELTEKQISRGLFDTSSEMRNAAFEKIKGAVIPDGPLIDGREKKAIEEDDGQFPVFYQIKDLKVSEPYEESKVTVEHNEIGSVEYDSIKVDVDFESVETVFSWPTDANFDGVVTEKSASDKFQDIAVTLVRSGDLWFIYDVEDSEYTLNVRLATWSGRGGYNVSSDQKVVGEYVMESTYHFGREEMFDD